MKNLFTKITQQIRDFFGFSFVEIKSFWLLSCIMLIFGVVPVLLIIFENQKTFEKITNNEELDTLLAQMSPLDTNTEEQQQRFRANKSYFEKNKNTSFELPVNTFDPNKIPASQWQSYGVSKKVASSIRKYIDKGGRFRKNEDVKKVYNFKEEWYNRLAPYMIIEIDTNYLAKKEFKKYEKNYDSTKKHKKEYKKITFDINLADTAQLNAVKGIGEKTALSIIKYRERLGGFVNLEQLNEIFLLKNRPDVLKNLLSCVTLNIENIRKIKINEIEHETLRTHPYIQAKLSKIIINYRTQHGKFEKIEDLKKIKVLADSTYQKIVPYLQF